ncbi:MAG: glutamine synthetase III [Chloroflexi bacterium]|uniref:Glutamine synthetase III n=1 Tax=Candidatus Chlorohelix allophototropha TaxID=3003348 RepID=A0A8T7M5L3_9CHLR|nr:glutamine synthetase III [Chloroflexota bacterium]WJW69297.1 glutamine synthetase III [Chloroflexota bacterium L227-S17]
MANLPSGNPRLWALNQVSHRQTRQFDWPRNADGQYLRVTDIYGINTFSTKAMKEKLSKQTFQKLQATIKQGKKLDRSIADEVAHAIKEWAIENGATHFCHWFQPQTGLTAEKHDAFLSFDDENQPIERFSGSQLIQSEPDASSFPSGGRRSTFEARGYTAWDPSSPAYISEEPNGKTLCIPSVFISYHGEALDHKTPLLRSIEVLSKSALPVLKLFGNNSDRVVATLGPEQEYFLIDKAYYMLRPDLIATGRTLLGSPPPKGQQLEDHYFGSIKDRIQSFMQEAEFELYKLGIPIKTRHNEVAPSQFETAPIFEELNIASDHNQMVMEYLRAVAERHDLAMLLHEKPFAGVNGSGKHNNWSMQDSDGNNLLEPGKTPNQNLQFLVFLVATLKGVYKRSGLLRSAIAGSGNDHRLGANEAPPAIISAFLGEQLTGILDAIEAGTQAENGTEERIIGLSISHLPDVARDYTDRNRTSPFAFTGNKFEFRAVASSAAISPAMTTLNAAVAEALDDVYAQIKASLDKGVEFKKAVLEVVKKTIIETKAIRFEGNNYSEEWVEEAARRGLPNLRKSPEALAEMVKPESIEFFVNSGIFTKEEVEARYAVRVERYVKDVDIELQTLKELVKTYVLPAAYKQQQLLATSIQSLKDVLGGDAPEHQVDDLKSLSKLINKLHKLMDKFEELTTEHSGHEDLDKEAQKMGYKVLPAMLEIREVCDALELVISDDIWPLPKYREILFLS